jgi:uncharacterized protein
MMEDTDLGCYVYIFRNPEDNKPFYIGKGTGPRGGNLNGRNPDTTAKIEEIRKVQKKEPIIELLRYGLDEETAFMYEGLAIDVMGVENLTNRKGGRKETIKWPTKPDKSNRQPPDPINEANITEPSIIIRPNQLYHSGMSDEELYDATRGIWKLGERRKKARYVFAVFQGIILDVYKIKGEWHPAGTTFVNSTRPNMTRDNIAPERLGDWEFIREPVENEIREKYRLKSVKRYLTSRNPILYVKC